MNLQQLRHFCGVVDSRFSISRAAQALHTSQPGINKQIQILEHELGVDLLVRQGNPAEIAKWVLSGEADMGISATPPDELPGDLVFLDCNALQLSVITVPGHPLHEAGPLTLAAIAAYPIVTLGPAFTGGATVMKAFDAAGIKPRIVMSAIDTDVIKAYVGIRLGIAILPSIAFGAARDLELRLIDASHLFEPTVTRVQLQRGKYLRDYMRDFITMIHPPWDEAVIAGALHKEEA